mgnify:CR=1 FL=1
MVDGSSQCNFAIKKYEFVTDMRVALLIEQAAIARALDLKSGTLRSQVLQNNSAVLNTSNVDSPLYLMGYVALEKELELLKSRTNPEKFIKELVTLEDKKLEILNDQTIQIATRAFSLAPIGTDQFSAAVYDTAELNIQSEREKNSLLLVLSIVLGGMLGIFVLLRLPCLNELLELTNMINLTEVVKSSQHLSVPRALVVFITTMHSFQYFGLRLQVLRAEIQEPIKAEMFKLIEAVQARRHVLDEIIVQKQGLQRGQVANFVLNLRDLVVIQNKSCQISVEQHQISWYLL